MNLSQKKNTNKTLKAVTVNGNRLFYCLSREREVIWKD